MSLDNFKKQTITWDMINQSFEQPIQIMEGDVNARTLLLKITDNGSVLDLTGYSVKLTYKYVYKSQSGFIMLTPNDISKGEFTLIIPTEMTVSGLIKSNLILLNEDKEQVIVSKNLTFISDNSTVTDLAQEVNNKIDDFTKLLLENMPQVMRSELNDLHAQTDSNTSNIELKANLADVTSLQNAMTKLQNEVETFGITPENSVTIKSLLDEITGILSDLSQKGIDISDLKTKMASIYTNALSYHAEILTARGGKSSLDARLDGLDAKDTELENETTAQLAHKIGGGVKAEPEDLSATTLGLVTGTGGPINLLSVPQDNSVTMAKLATDSLKNLPVKIPSKNLFDKTKVTTGFMWDANSGAKWTANFYSISDYIAMTANTLITTYRCVRVIEWTSAKTYIKGTSLLSNTTMTITTSPTTAYITIDAQNEHLDTTQIELGGTYTGYAPFKLGLNPTDIFDSSITNSKLTVATQAFLDKAVVTQLDIILPTTVYATVGREFNIYYRNVVLTDTNLDDYDIMINVSKGELMDDRYSFTPVAGDIGSFVAKFYIRDKKGNNLFTKNVTIEVVAEVTPSTAKKVIFIGDSLTDDGSNGSYIETLKNMMGSRLELLGTRGTAPYLHEGRGGWSTVTYLTNTTATNKFWNPGTLAFDFTYYMTQQGYTSVDDVVIFIGTNDLSTNIETLITNLKTIRTSILAFNANIKVHFVLTPPPSSSFYAFGRSRLFQWDAENKFKGFNKRYITEFEPNVIPVNLNLDAWYDFPRITLTRSQRNTETIEIVEERYHCNQVGYDKFADVIYSYLMKKWA